MLAIFACVVRQATSFHVYDLIVYGGTPAGIVSAVSASREGLNVALVLESEHLGGMTTSGLSHADKNIPDSIGGISREFFKRAGAKYGEKLSWSIEPHKAKEVFLEMLEEASVDLFYESALKHSFVENNKIKRIDTHSFNSFSAEVFVDASYEGDLLAKSGVSYKVGREAKTDYYEHFAGVVNIEVYHQFPDGVSAYDDDGELLPYIQDESFGKLGDGGPQVQAYNFRFCWTDRPENRVPFLKPAKYDPRDYLLLKRVFKVNPKMKLSDIFFFMKLPNGKYDVNNRGPFSTDFIGMNWEYPDADYKKRREIWQEHKDYTQGLLYFLTTDKGVPAHIQGRLNQLGHCRDEFREYSHWPPQLYVREARRMRGEYVFTEHDLLTNTYKSDSIGLGSSGIETHYVRRYVTKEGWVKNEGFKRTRARVFEIPYRSLIPKKGEVRNLIVPVCVSATEVGYSAIRMEPVYMILGHAAGVASSMAIKEKKSFYEIDVKKLQDKLKSQSQIIRP